MELTATANEGYVFVNWTDEDDNVISTEAEFTYIMPAMDKTLTANLEEEYVYVCGDTITDIDGNEYATVLIGDQCWMAENLRVSQYRDGDDIPTNLEGLQWGNTTSGAYAIYPHEDVTGIDSPADMVTAYGKLYNWYAVDDDRGLCPEGWDVPSDTEWTTLTNYLGGSSVAGGKMKSTRTAPNDAHPRWDSPNTGATNSDGFSGLPAGIRIGDGTFQDIGRSGRWWTSTEAGSNAWIRSFAFNSSSVGRSFFPKSHGRSIRCIRDSE